MHVWKPRENCMLVDQRLARWLGQMFFSSPEFKLQRSFFVRRDGDDCLRVSDSRNSEITKTTADENIGKKLPGGRHDENADMMILGNSSTIWYNMRYVWWYTGFREINEKKIRLNRGGALFRFFFCSFFQNLPERFTGHLVETRETSGLGVKNFDARKKEKNCLQIRPHPLLIV